VFQTARAVNTVLLLKVVVEEYINHISPYHFQFRADPSGAWRAPWNRPEWFARAVNLPYPWHRPVPDELGGGGGGGPTPGGAGGPSRDGSGWSTTDRWSRSGWAGRSTTRAASGPARSGCSTPRGS